MSDEPVVRTHSTAPAAPTTDVAIPLDVITGKSGGTVTIRSGITTLVGPNGSGKTRALRSIQRRFEVAARRPPMSVFYPQVAPDRSSGTERPPIHLGWDQVQARRFTDT